MNKKILCVSLLLSLFLSFCIIKAYSALSNYKSVIYFAQKGAYLNYNNATLVAKSIPNSFIIKEGSLYKVFIGAYKSEEALDKAITLLNMDSYVYKKKVVIDSKELANKLDVFDKAILGLNNVSNLNLVLKEENLVLKDYFDILLILD